MATLMELWSESGSLWAWLWGQFYHMCGSNVYILYCFGAPIVGILAFTITNSFFAFIDLTGKPEALVQYKIQDEKAVPVNWETYKRTLKRVSFNATVMSVLFQHLTYPLAMWRGLEYTPDNLPSFTSAAYHIFTFIIIEVIAFYYLHRLFHHPTLYKHVHKTHHEWRAPVGVCSIYCHPLEQLVVNLLPVGVAPIITGSHMCLGLLWYVVVIVMTTVDHSGYHFPFLPSSESHDFHHAKFNQCYGVTGLLDYLHGTNAQFRHSRCYTRHTLLTGLTPAKVLYPDLPAEEKRKGEKDR